MDTETKKIGKHFQLPLLFKNFTLYLPNNRTVTEKCLTSFSPANISTSVQRCFQVDMTSWRRTTSNQRWNNVACVNVEIYNIQQRSNNIIYFNVELNHVRQRRNNVVLFSVDFHNVGQRRNNIANMTNSKKDTNKPRFKSKIIFLRFKEYAGLNIFFSFLSF